MKRYHTYTTTKTMLSPAGRWADFEEAQAEIDARDQTIAHLKALLYRAADTIPIAEHHRDNRSDNDLLAEIEAALA